MGYYMAIICLSKFSKPWEVVAYLKARLLQPTKYQPLKWLATIVSCLRHRMCRVV